MAPRWLKIQAVTLVHLCFVPGDLVLTNLDVPYRSVCRILHWLFHIWLGKWLVDWLFPRLFPLEPNVEEEDGDSDDGDSDDGDSDFGELDE